MEQAEHLDAEETCSHRPHTVLNKGAHAAFNPGENSPSAEAKDKEEEEDPSDDPEEILSHCSPLLPEA